MSMARDPRPRDVTAPDGEAPATSTPGVLPPEGRDLDPEREAAERALVDEPARPLTADEQQAAQDEAPRAERVYAPASERVPRTPHPGHVDLVARADPATAERRAVAPADRTDPRWRRSPREGERRSGATSPDGAMLRGLVFGAALGVVTLGIIVVLRAFLDRRREQRSPRARLRRQAGRTMAWFEQAPRLARRVQWQAWLEPARRRVRAQFC
jgi:hypothetical protein